LPWAACSRSITSMTGALPWRTTSPHEVEAATIAASPRILVTLRIQLLALDDSRRDEDQQLGALIVNRVAFEQPAEERDLAQPGRAVVRRLLLAGEDAADDRGLPVADQHLRGRGLRVDRGDAADLTAEIG